MSLVLSGASDPGLTLEQRERQAFGADHMEIGVKLLKDWQLPDSVWTATQGLVRTEDGPATEHSGKILRVADAVAAFLGGGDQQNAESMQRLAGLALTETGLEPQPLRELLEGVAEDWIHYGRLFSLDTQNAPDFEAIQQEAEEQRNVLQLASEMEVVNLKSQNEQLSELARRDRLTGALNRAAFDESLPAAVATARDQQRSVAVLMIDVDRFKSINDTHGHPAGDAVLKHLARVLDDNARRRDEVFRYGGEEFAVIAPDCSKEVAGSLAEGFRAAIESAPHVELKRTIPLTISVGVAWVEAADLPDTPGDLVEYADQRFYEAKRGGRNQWRIDAEDQATIAEPVGAPSPSGGLFSRLFRGK